MALTRLAELRARRALAGAKLDAELRLTLLESVTNEVWSAGDQYVIRVNRRIHSRLSREAELSPLLPPEVRYPTLVSAGAGNGADWVVLEKVAGLPLVRWWGGLSPDERKRAVTEVAGALAALHATAVPAELAAAIDPPQLLWTGAFATDPLLAGLDRVGDLPGTDTLLVADAVDYVRSHRSALDPFVASTLVHGDVHFQNVLWDGVHVTAVLDLEFARAAPADLDLDVFLRFCGVPALFVPPTRESEVEAAAYRDVPGWLAEADPGLFAHPRLGERLRLYALAFDTKELLADPPRKPLNQLGADHPYRRLADTVRGVSYLDHLGF